MHMHAHTHPYHHSNPFTSPHTHPFPTTPHPRFPLFPCGFRNVLFVVLRMRTDSYQLVLGVMRV